MWRREAKAITVRFQTGLLVRVLAVEAVLSLRVYCVFPKPHAKLETCTYGVRRHSLCVVTVKTPLNCRGHDKPRTNTADENRYYRWRYGRFRGLKCSRTTKWANTCTNTDHRAYFARDHVTCYGERVVKAKKPEEKPPYHETDSTCTRGEITIQPATVEQCPPVVRFRVLVRFRVHVRLTTTNVFMSHLVFIYFVLRYGPRSDHVEVYRKRVNS